LRRGTVSAYRQIERFQSEKKTYRNAQMMPKMIRKNCAISAEGEKLLENAITRLGLSARAHDRILKVARTIAHLDGGLKYRAAPSQRSHPAQDARSLLLGLKRDSDACLLAPARLHWAAVALLPYRASYLCGR